MKSKKGQFTILVVLAILVLLTFMAIFMIRGVVVDQLSEAETDQLISDYVESDTLKSYVEECLKTVAEQAVLLSAIQGGNIWLTQDGPVKLENIAGEGLGKNYLPLIFTGFEYDVPYLVKDISHTQCQKLAVNSQAPEYPLQGANLEALNLVTFAEICPIELDSGFYGVRKMKRLCEVYGPNWRGSTDRPGVYSTCEGKYAYATELPVQYQLSNYSEARLSQCVEPSVIETHEGFKIEFLNKPDVAFIFGREDITINATFPVKISYEDKPPITINKAFYQRVNARYKTMYEFFRELMQGEVWYPNYNPSNPNNYTKANHYRSSFKVELYKDCSRHCVDELGPHKYDDVLVVTDERSLVGDRELMMVGLIKNRAPILDLLPNYDIELTDANEDGHCDALELTLPKIEFVDPDEDDVSIEAFSTLSVGVDNDLDQVKITILTIGDFTVDIYIKDPEGLFDFQTVNIHVESDGCTVG